MQRLKCLFVTAFVAVCMLALPTRLLAEDNDCDDNAMKANITALNNSGLSGTVRLCLSEDGAAARLRVDGTKAGHAYTAWFFYCPTTALPATSPCYAPGNPNPFTVGRFDSALAEGTTTRFAARVGGLAPAVGASEIDLVIVDHGDVSGMSALKRAMNVLTPAGLPFSALAVFKP